MAEVECFLPTNKTVMTTAENCRSQSGIVLRVQEGTTQPQGPTAARPAAPPRTDTYRPTETPRPNPLITSIQILLKARGFDPGAADGFAGPQTVNAIRAYQQARGLVVTGQPSEQLLAALAADGNPASKSPEPVRPQPPMREVGSGSGFFINGAGDVVTNEHVIRGCSAARIEGRDGEAVPARVVHRDQSSDLALLRTNEKPAVWARFRSDSPLRAGDSVVVVGFPLGQVLGNRLNAATGIIAALAGFANDTQGMTITAPIQPGNSGGPLLDMHGLVVGVVYAGLGERFQRATGVLPQNVNFAVKASAIETFLSSNGATFERSSPRGESVTLPEIIENARKFTVRIVCLRPV